MRTGILIAVAVFVVDTTGDPSVAAFIDELRESGLAVLRAYDARSMKAQMKVADRSGARFALVIGPAELAAGEVTMRDLRADDHETAQRRVERSAVVGLVRAGRNGDNQ